MACSTRSRVRACTPVSSLTTRETVFSETSAWAATSLIVGLRNVASRGGAGRVVAGLAWEGRRIG